MNIKSHLNNFKLKLSSNYRAWWLEKHGERRKDHQSEPPLRGLLPTIDLFKVMAREELKEIEVFGLSAVKRRLVATKRVENKGNKYLQKKFKLLYKHAKNKEKERFWFQAKILLTRSYAFRLLNLRKVEKNWYKDLHTKEVKNSLLKLNKLIKDFSYKFELKRVYIPKPDGSKRGLSVPALHFRIWASMWYMILAIWLTANEPKFWGNQHGGKPGRGVNSAWKYLYNDVIKNQRIQSIFEYDIKKFFDRVNHSVILEALKESDVPDPITRWLMNAIKNSECSNLTLDEWKQDLKNKGLEENQLKKITTIEEAKEWSRKMAKGVPQGMALSPILSCLAKSFVLKDFESRTVSYVDDGIIYSEEEPNIESFYKAMQTLEINSEKSSWLKRDGTWTKERFKFLGIEYNISEDSMRAASRSGRNQKLFPKANWENCKNLNFLKYAETHGEIAASIKWEFFDTLLNWTWSPEDLKLESINSDLITCRYKHCFFNDYSNLIRQISPKSASRLS